MEISVVICCFNARNRIEYPLQALSQQKVDSSHTWEVIIVDNASTDGTAQFARDFAAQRGLAVRICHEPNLGLMFARKRGAMEAKGNWIAFCDDDNVPAPDWISNILSFIHTSTDVGMFSGRVIPIVTNPELRPESFKDEDFDLLGCRDWGKDVRRLEKDLPIGAGMVIHTKLMRYVFDEIGFYSVGRQGNSLMGCEDLELALILKRLQWGLWYVGTSEMGHIMPPNRLEEAYMEKLKISSMTSTPWLDLLSSDAEKVQVFHFMTEVVKDYLKVIRYKVLSLFPVVLHPKLRSAGFFKKFYRARMHGYLALLRDQKKINKMFERIAAAPRELKPQSAMISEMP